MASAPILLPSGDLSTNGNQIVDASGNPVRIAAVSWNGMHVRNGVPLGLDQANYQDILKQIVSIGFNVVRFPICDMLSVVGDFPGNGLVDPTINADLHGLSCMAVLDLIIAYAGSLGLRVILESRNNEGRTVMGRGVQPNGLWYDAGGSSDGTDGAGVTGNIADADFQANWVRTAIRYKASTAIIGYDIRCEPKTQAGATSPGGVTWGDGTDRDLRAMYQRLGNAIHAVDRRPLIICQGPRNPGATFATGLMPDGIDYGTGTAFSADNADLSGVRIFPVTLTRHNKVVYSVHEYPQETSGNNADIGGLNKVAQMNAAWGFLVKNNVAPVFVGEMGSWFNGTVAQVSASTAWANTMVDYLNGKQSGGPKFTAGVRPVSWGWWDLETSSDPNSGVPNYGVLTAWAGGTARPDQLNVYSRMFYTGGAVS